MDIFKRIKNFLFTSKPHWVQEKPGLPYSCSECGYYGNQYSKTCKHCGAVITASSKPY